MPSLLAGIAKPVFRNEVAIGYEHSPLAGCSWRRGHIRRLCDDAEHESIAGGDRWRWHVWRSSRSRTYRRPAQRSRGWATRCDEAMAGIAHRRLSSTFAVRTKERANDASRHHHDDGAVGLRDRSGMVRQRGRRTYMALCGVFGGSGRRGWHGGPPPNSATASGQPSFALTPPRRSRRS